jgi:hypothetical protein
MSHLASRRRIFEERNHALIELDSVHLVGFFRQKGSEDSRSRAYFKAGLIDTRRIYDALNDAWGAQKVLPQTLICTDAMLPKEANKLATIGEIHFLPRT